MVKKYKNADERGRAALISKWGGNALKLVGVGILGAATGGLGLGLLAAGGTGGFLLAKNRSQKRKVANYEQFMQSNPNLREMTTKSAGTAKTGAAAQAAAQASSSNVLTATASANLYRVAKDQNSAGSTRIAGAVQNLRTVMQGIGGLSNNTEILAHFETSIGSKLNEFSGYVEAWNSIAEPVITSIGSITDAQTTNEALQEAVTTDLETVTNTESNKANKNPEDQPVLLTPNVKFGI